MSCACVNDPGDECRYSHDSSVVTSIAPSDNLAPARSIELCLSINVLPVGSCRDTDTNKATVHGLGRFLPSVVDSGSTCVPSRGESDSTAPSPVRRNMASIVPTPVETVVVPQVTMPYDPLATTELEF